MKEGRLKKFWWLWLFYPIVLVLLLELVKGSFSRERVPNIIENILFLLMLLLPGWLFIRGKYRKPFFLWSFVFFTFCCFIEALYFWLFQINFRPSAVFVFLESNPGEAGEFIKTYVGHGVLMITVAFAVPVFFAKHVAEKLADGAFYRSRRYGIMSLLLIEVALFLGLRKTELIAQNLPYLLVKSSLQYKNDLNKMSFFKEKHPQGVFKNLKENTSTNRTTYVVLIGESTSRGHMQLYGYNRNTNPLLSELKDELLIYNNIISPHTYTYASLTEALTTGNYEDEDRKYEGSLVQLFNAAGYKTFWISNHSEVFAHSTMLTRIAKAADVQHFDSRELLRKNHIYDEDIFPELERVFQDKAKKKIIFLHLMGTHYYYEKRYPKKADFFKDPPGYNRKLTVEQEQIVNAYDNAVRYNDQITYEVIKKLKLLKHPSFLLYFSDHGDEVYENEDFYGHFEDKPTKNMFDIPFFLWHNSYFKKPEDFEFKVSRAYMIDDLFHSIAHLSGLSESVIKPERSVFSEVFKPRKRMILNNQDYDQRYGNK